MIINVHMLAFMNGEIREVIIPDDINCIETVLNQTFMFGQNDFQPYEDRCSVSVGDVIELSEEFEKNQGFYLVTGDGFKKLSQAEYDDYLKAPQRDRGMRSYLQ